MPYFSLVFILICCISNFFLSNSNASVVYPALKKASPIIAKRLASKEISEIIEIVLKLQMECQQEGSKDVCDGVLNVIAVLQERVTRIEENIDTETLAFIDGLISGIYEANQAITMSQSK